MISETAAGLAIGSLWREVNEKYVGGVKLNWKSSKKQGFFWIGLIFQTWLLAQIFTSIFSNITGAMALLVIPDFSSIAITKSDFLLAHVIYDTWKNVLHQ